MFPLNTQPHCTVKGFGGSGVYGIGGEWCSFACFK